MPSIIDNFMIQIVVLEYSDKVGLDEKEARKKRAKREFLIKPPINAKGRNQTVIEDVAAETRRNVLGKS